MPPRTNRPHRANHHGRIAALAAGALVIVPMLGASASADTPGAVTPFLDCVALNPVTGDYTAYFGYDNTLPSPEVIAVGDDNQIFPADAFQGQPTYFNTGNYPRVFEVTFDPTLFSSIAWILNNVEVDASASSPACVGAVTAPAELITGTSATITGVVIPDGTDTTYQFEWGTTPSLGQTTPVVDEGSGGDPALVQAQLTDLEPGTPYYYRLDESTGFAPGTGQVLSFTTVAPVAPVVTPLSVTTTTLPGGMVGKAYSATLAATGGTGPYTWSITSGSLPSGLTLNHATGVISGIPARWTAYCTAWITVEVTDSASAKATHRFVIQIAPAPHWGW